MNPPQGEVIPIATTSQLNQESQKLTRLFHQTKKTLTILSYKDVTDESVKPVLNTSARYEPNDESPSFSINNAKDVKANLISVTAAIHDPKYHVNPNKAVIWLRRFMKALNVDYVKDSYLEGIQFPKDETTDVSLKYRLWFLKLQGPAQQQIQQSLTLHRKVLKKGSSNFERNITPQQAYEAPDTTRFGYAFPTQCRYPWPYNPTPKPQGVAKMVLSDHSSHLRPTSIRYLLARQWYLKIATDPVKMQDNAHR